MRSPRPSLPVLLGIVAVVAIALVHSGEIRARADAGLGRGMPAHEAELARGFVLGEDEGTDAETKENFRRSELSHLLAVSGENVTLLALLAMPLLGALGIPLRERLIWFLGLIAVYVPLAGAGPSIQRAAAMGAAGLVATLAGRRALPLVATSFDGGGGACGAARAGELRIEVLEVGQGDAILLQPARAPAVLVDGGPPGDGLASKLQSAGVERLGAAVITHEQSDHSAGIEELLGDFPVARLVYARLSRALIAAAEASGAVPVRVAQGGEVRSGRLGLEVLFAACRSPRRATCRRGPESAGACDPRPLARLHDVAHRRRRGGERADRPRPLDVLKVAHHGSDDGGLGALLNRSQPQLAVISVGESNPYGHPTAGTLRTLAAHGVRTLRADRDGDVVIEVGPDSIEIGG